MWLLVVRFSLGLVYVVTLCALWVVFRLWMLWGLIGLINSVVYSYLVVYFDTFVVWLIVCELGLCFVAQLCVWATVLLVGIVCGFRSKCLRFVWWCCVSSCTMFVVVGLVTLVLLGLFECWVFWFWFWWLL